MNYARENESGVRRGFEREDGLRREREGGERERERERESLLTLAHCPCTLSPEC